MNYIMEGGDRMYLLTWGCVLIETILVFNNLYFAIKFLPILVMLVLIDLIVDWRD